MIHGVAGLGGIQQRAGSAPRSQFGESEIENLGVAAVGNKDVRRLDVAVDNALGVGGIERVSYFNRQIEYGVDVQRPMSDGVLQRLAVEVLQNDEGPAAFFAYVINRADVGMIERRGSFGFALEAA